MKRSPTSSCSSSDSSTDPPPLSAKPKIKRSRRNLNPEKRKSANSPARRSSVFRGVTRHRWTGRFEAHLWDKNWNPIQNKKGRQGAYDDEEAAARTYDLAALKYWGPDSILNFPMETYAKEFEEMQSVSKEEYLATLRRRSSGFSRGVSKYRGVARHHHNGRWEARIGRVFGNKYLYLGTYSTQEEAAAAYDIAAIEYRGLNAVTNFDISHYSGHPKQSLLLQQQQQQQQQQCIATFTESQKAAAPCEIPQPPDSFDHSSVIMDSMEDHPWSLCMDSGFSLLPDPDISLGRSSELPDFFNDSGFEENIEFLFEGSKENGINLDEIFENSGELERSFLEGMVEQGGVSCSTTVSYPYPINICS
ncbi:hypothetical protein HHK36_011592 [Tetracentron sinense]|uniref:AP2/ERF domain-containing protein n=1 Tax=Tetracentron sinense TaxID=13715 RepID=A0A835DGE3_TETSI|nr:hypothetical protein HHK36_011592 [Tetracentron sinense]